MGLTDRQAMAAGLFIAPAACLFLLLGVGPIVRAAETRTQAQSLSAQGQSLSAQAQDAFDGKRYADAAKLFDEAAADPQTTDAGTALLMEGKSLTNLNDFAGADKALRKCLARNARSSEALYLLGYVLQRENKPRESLEVFTRAAAVEPPTANDLKIVALDYVLLDDYADAVHWLERALKADPLNAEAWYDLGRARMTQGDFVPAEQAFQHALKISPRDVKSENNLGLVYEAENRVPEALRAYEAAIADQQGIAHPSEQPLLNYGTLLISQNRSADAIRVLGPAVQIAPTDSACHEQLARAYAQAGKVAEAQQQMEQAVLLDQQNARLHYELGQLYRRVGRSKESEAELKQSAKLYGSHSTPEGR